MPPYRRRLPAGKQESPPNCGSRNLRERYARTRAGTSRSVSFVVIQTDDKMPCLALLRYRLFLPAAPHKSWREALDKRNRLALSRRRSFCKDAHEMSPGSGAGDRQGGTGFGEGGASRELRQHQLLGGRQAEAGGDRSEVARLFRRGRPRDKDGCGGMGQQATARLPAHQRHHMRHRWLRAATQRGADAGSSDCRFVLYCQSAGDLASFSSDRGSAVLRWPRTCRMGLPTANMVELLGSRAGPADRCQQSRPRRSDCPALRRSIELSSRQGQVAPIRPRVM
jgi:hypothetical protein